MHTSKNTGSDYKDEYKIQATLAEYNALISEYRDRMKIQNNLLQIHVTVLTAIMGVAVSQQASMFLLLIPIESSIFGIWYFDVAITMLEIGVYIRYKIKKKIQTDFNDKYIMGWEADFNGEKENNLTAVLKEHNLTAVFNRVSPRRMIRHTISLGIVGVSFFGPALISFLYLRKSNIVELYIYELFVGIYKAFFITILLVVGYYIARSLKIDQEYMNEKNIVTKGTQ